MTLGFELYDEPKDVCQSCTVYMAEGEVRQAEGEITTHGGLRIQLCRSCVTPVRSALKSLFKRMEKRAQEMNEKRGTKR